MPRSTRMPPLQSLMAFEAAARHLSFTAAAEELHSTQPAISQQIRSLEHFLDTPLFRRIYRGVELTDAGKLLFQAVQNGFNAIRAALAELQRQASTPHINVATDFAFAAYWLMPRLPEFRLHYPQVDIRIQTSQVARMLPDDGVDVSIVFGDQQLGDLPDSWQWFRLFQERVFPVCSPALLANQHPIASLEQLATLPLLKLYAEGNPSWLNWDSFFQHHHRVAVPGEAVLEFNNYTLLIQAAIAGQGVALGWGNLVDDLLDKGFLAALPAFTVQTKQGYFVAHQAQPSPSVEVAAFVDWLQHQAEGRI